MQFTKTLLFLTALITSTTASPVAIPDSSESEAAVSVPVPWHTPIDLPHLQKRAYVPSSFGQCKVGSSSPSISLVNISSRLEKLCSCLLPKPYLAQPMVGYSNQCYISGGSAGKFLHAKVGTPKMDREYFGEEDIWITKETCKKMLVKSVLKCSVEKGSQVFRGWIETTAASDGRVVDWVQPVRYWFAVGTKNTIYIS